ncbi:MAG: class I SAM-dependent methyltransferase [Kofleriaceae bacterium]
MDEQDQALLELGRFLRQQRYAFTTVTPETHRRNNARARPARSLRDAFGWSRAFEAGLVPDALLHRLQHTGWVVPAGARYQPTVRFSTLGDGLYAHSPYPTVDEAAVFFGPDTYRFCTLLAARIDRAQRCVDVGCGSGAGALSLASRVDRLVLADINPQAVRFARVNAELAGVTDRVELVTGDLFAPVAGDLDLVIANPPYLLDDGHRIYRDGGGSAGEGLAVRIVREGLARLVSGGRLVLYTGAAIVDGHDVVRAALVPVFEAAGARWSYEELDPDVFGEELDAPAYAAVERIAVVAAVATAC